LITLLSFILNYPAGTGRLWEFIINYKITIYGRKILIQ
jgi:hypothetical protein